MGRNKLLGFAHAIFWGLTLSWVIMQVAGPDNHKHVVRWLTITLVVAAIWYKWRRWKRSQEEQ